MPLFWNSVYLVPEWPSLELKTFNVQCIRGTKRKPIKLNDGKIRAY